MVALICVHFKERSLYEHSNRSNLVVQQTTILNVRIKMVGKVGYHIKEMIKRKGELKVDR